MANQVYIDGDGALFRGPSRSFPQEVWDERKRRWFPYTGNVPKPIEWGDLIPEEKALEWMKRP